MVGDTRVTSTNNTLLPIYNGELTFEHNFLHSFFLLLTFVNMVGFTKHSYRTKELMLTSDADCVNHNYYL